MSKQHEGLRLSNKESNQITRESIEAALFLLMEEKDFHSLTISEIVKRAGVSRTAYYRNYSSKEDILNAALKELIKNINDIDNQYSFETQQKDYWRTLFETVQADAKSFKAVLKADFGQHILQGITDDMIHPNQQLENRYDRIFWGGAVYNILAQWITEDMSTPIDEMVEACLYITEHFNKDFA